MEEEGVRNFKELRAKFQKFEDPPLPGPIKFPAGVSQKDGRGHTQPTQSPANRKCLSTHQHRPLSAQRGELQTASSSSGPPEKSAECPARNAHEADTPLDANKARAETSNKEKRMTISSFRYKLWNWEKVSSQKADTSPALHLTNSGNKTLHLEGQKATGLAQGKLEKSLEATGVQTLPPQSHLMAQRSPMASEDSPSSLPWYGSDSPEDLGAEGSPRSSACQPVYECELGSLVPEKPESRHHQLPTAKPLPSIETLGPPPPKPSKPPHVNLQAFHRQPAAVPKTPKEVTVKEGTLSSDGVELEEPHNYDTTISYLRHSGNSINLSAAEESAEATYEIEIEELQKPWRTLVHPKQRPKDEENNMKEKEPCELEPQKPGKDSHPHHPPKVVAYEETPEKAQGTGAHEDRQSVPAGNQEAVTDITQNRLFSRDVTLTRQSQEKGGYMEALEVTKEAPSPTTIRSDSSSEKTYDDVDCSRADTPKWDFSSSFASDSEENSEEIYEDIYKAKNNDLKTDVDGRAALRRLQQLFRKERGIFRMKKNKPKENVRNGFSVSLPDLGPRSQEVIIYDDVDTSEKELKDEDQSKTWKAKFFTTKRGIKGKKGSDGSKSFSPRNFFRTKKQNFIKNRMEKEEKLFRERFQYGKEISVINRAVACSSNSRNGIFDLPITPGEQLEVIDTTEQNLVICRNSKGKYGYVLIDHLHFKHQG
ncbi:FYN-binding protein 2 [Meriones unguiculatus]|uniref:FYN-binding protein 2 n=1 Tax=Meriones unguiculatus TaxID=10047 RepID=UPI00293EC97E|nr:FYN-binding protein 2 [Meriones unguiculatus]